VKEKIGKNGRESRLAFAAPIDDIAASEFHLGPAPDAEVQPIFHFSESFR
jgi:hypothetical protein